MSTPTPPFKLQTLPHPPLLLPSHIAAYKKIRLLSLQLDPQAFYSTYERESAFSEEVWEVRVGASGRVTFYASTTGGGVEEGLETGGEGGEEPDWIGTATILYPEFVLPVQCRPTLPANLKLKGVTHEDVYFLVGMWVRPEWRRRGIGRDLVLHALRHVDERERERNRERERAGERERNASGQEGKLEKLGKVKVTFLDVQKANKVARGMYEAIGFRTNDESELVGQDENGTAQMYYIHDSDA